MNNRRAIVIAALVVIAIGAVVVLTLRAFAPRSDAAAPPPVAAAVLAPADVQPADASGADARAAEPPPPWLQAQPPAATPVAPAADPEQALRERQLAKLQASMQGVIAVATARSAETHQHLRDALDTLEAMDDPALTAQIDLAAVRHNLETSIRMQALAQQLQQIAAQPESPERQQHMDASIAELRRLQAQLRPDVRAPGSTLPAPPTLQAVP